MNIAFALFITGASFFTGAAFGMLFRKRVPHHRGHGQLLNLRHDGLPQGGMER